MERKRGASGARYVFAGRSESEVPPTTKVCPRCGEVLFADMDVCYGCLYDFSKDARGYREALAPVSLDPAGASEVASREALVPPLDFDDLDEVDDEPENVASETAPRHRRDAASADDTLDLAQEGLTQVFGTSERLSGDLRVRVSAKDIEVLVPLGAKGLSVGRGDDNDVILRSRLVSRHHVRVLRGAPGLLVEDLGATNPAELDGVALQGTAPFGVKSVLTVCGVTFSLAVGEGG